MQDSKSPQDVKQVYTSDGIPRPNLLSREDFIKRVLGSGEVTRIAQHLAVVIFLLAEGKNQLKVSVRDLERITGWSRTAIRDHISELRVFMNVTLGMGRAKAIFELQGVIEDALAAAVVAGSRATTVATSSVVASQPDATFMASQAAASDFVASQDATNQEMASQDATSVVASEPATNQLVVSQPAILVPVVASQPATTRLVAAQDAIPVPYTEREESSYYSNSSLSDAVEQQIQVNGVAIYGPGFTLDYRAIDLAAGMIGMPSERARAIAEICARDWAANGKKPNAPMAMVKKAIMNDFNQGQVMEVRLDAAKAANFTKQQPESRAARLLRHVEQAAEKGGRS